METNETTAGAPVVRMVDAIPDPVRLEERYRNDPAVLHYDWTAFRFATLPGAVPRLEFLQAAGKAGILTAKGHAELKRLEKAARRDDETTRGRGEGMPRRIVIRDAGECQYQALVNRRTPVSCIQKAGKGKVGDTVRVVLVSETESHDIGPMRCIHAAPRNEWDIAQGRELYEFAPVGEGGEGTKGGAE